MVMSLQRGTLIGDTLDRLPAPVVRHLTRLQDGKLALSLAIFKNSGDDGWVGASDAAMDILGQVVEVPVEFKRCGRMEGVFLKKSLFRPLKANLTPLESLVYQAALNTAEIQMRRLHDSKELP
jgi:hypothetical protein